MAKWVAPIVLGAVIGIAIITCFLSLGQSLADIFDSVFEALTFARK